MEGRTCISGQPDCDFGAAETFDCACCGKTVCFCEATSGDDENTCSCHGASFEELCADCWLNQTDPEGAGRRQLERAELHGQVRFTFDEETR